VNDKLNCTALILAAGLSERMGFYKPLLKFSEEITFLEQLIAEAEKAGVPYIIVVANKAVNDIILSRPNFKIGKSRIVVNQQPENGRMSSIKQGLSCLDREDYCILINSDNPFVYAHDLETLMEGRKPNCIVQPVVGERNVHPIIIAPEICSKIILQEDSNRLDYVLGSYSKHAVVLANKKLMYNINTPQQYYDAFGRDISY